MKHFLLSFALFLVFVAGLFGVTGSVKAATVQEIQALIANLQAQIAQLRQQLQAAEGQQPERWCYNFTANLKIGDSGEGAKALRTALIKNGFPNLEAMGGAYEFTEQIA